jgi:hypothetical protein
MNIEFEPTTVKKPILERESKIYKYLLKDIEDDVFKIDLSVKDKGIPEVFHCVRDEDYSYMVM